MGSDIYHEKQIKELCALHTLNNLFQNDSAFSKSDLDIISYSLSPDSWINPHKSILGTGNYDINVIMSALENKGYRAIWFDKRKGGILFLLNISECLKTYCLNHMQLLSFLRNEMNSKEKELFVIVSHEVELIKGWCLDDDGSITKNSYIPTSSDIKFIDQESSMENSIEGE